MQNNFIPMIEPTPEFQTTRCKLIAFLTKLFLQYTTIISGLVSWYMYDYFIAIAVLLLTFLVMGIIRSKMRNSSIPPAQREYHYNDKGIANWYTYTHHCFEKL